ncbi:hypothetical protein [Lactococcus lactis]|uniref:hypothetical protein n=1 Tax=Lactococcus lactis TaxID=1358 RepID=UPI00117BAE7B|nr:hypothetical protein [Lactococcus lactis]
MIELTKKEYKLLKSIEDKDSTVEKVSDNLNLPFNHTLDLASNLKEEQLVFLDMALNISLTHTGRASIYRYIDTKRNDFRQSFWFPLLFTIIGAIIGVVGTLLAS